jgi:hypothetical protein
MRWMPTISTPIRKSGATLSAVPFSPNAMLTAMQPRPVVGSGDPLLS